MKIFTLLLRLEAMVPAIHPDLSIFHYRLNDGRITVSRRDAEDDRFIPLLEPLLSPGSHKLPNTEGYAVKVRIAGSMLIGTIDSSNGSLFRMWVVVDGRDLPRVVRPPRVLDVPLPACIVEVRRPGTGSACPLLVSSKMIWAIIAVVRSLPVSLLVTRISSPWRISLAIPVSVT